MKTIGITILVLSLLLVISSCSILPSGNEAGLELSKDEIKVENGVISSPVIAAITKKDTNPDPVSYTIRFLSPNADMVQFYSASEQPITSIQTALFKRKGDRLSEEFLVQAQKPEGSLSATWIAEIEITYNETVIDTKSLKIVVE